MSSLTKLVDDFMAMWNEKDVTRRRAIIASIWDERASYVDPVAEGKGREGIDAIVAGVQQRFPGHRFRRLSEVDEHHDRIRFTWELAPEGGAPIARGTDFGTVVDGHLQAITGFFDKTSAGT